MKRIPTLVATIIILLLTLTGCSLNNKLTSANGVKIDTDNFRQLYKTMLSIEIEDYTEDDSTDEAKCIATMRITTESDIVTEYKFYAYATRRCFMTVNGEGEFYVNRDMAAKLISDAKKVIAGIEVNSDARS